MLSPHIVKDVADSLLCRLDLHGPMRPMQIMETSGLSCGGATKLVDRMEAAGMVRRDRGGVPTDERSVLVELTPEGRRVVRDMARQLDKNIPATELLVNELLKLLGDNSPTAKGT